MSSAKNGAKKALLIKLGLLTGILVLGAVLILRGFEVRSLIDQGLAMIRNAGPTTFFVAMALVPGIGVPMLTFTLTAVPVFGERLGTVVVVLLSLLALTTNVVITYALARRGLRPWLSAFITRLGYKLPEVEEGDMTDLIVILRVTPGIPFFIQNYLLGLANVPFGRYLVVSCITSWPAVIAFLLFGEALLQGKGRLALLAITGLAALTAITHLVRKHYARKKVQV